MNEEAPPIQEPKKAASNGNGRKNSTSDAPMVGLPDAVEFIRIVHEKGLERAAMPKVAEGAGYSSGSSTPFYRRVSAARHFGLISSRGADLTELGQDCIRPTSEDATHFALVTAIQNVVCYTELLASYNGKRINPQILTHWFERKFDLNETAAAACAKSFVDTLRYAGAVSGDNLVNFSSSPEASHVAVAEPAPAKEYIAIEEPKKPDEGYRFELLLEPKSGRKFVIFSPPTVSSAELKRIQDWLSFQLLIQDPGEVGQP
jgi:hypothetical protein